MSLKRLVLLVGFCSLFVAKNWAHANELTVQVQDQNGAALEGVVVELLNASNTSATNTTIHIVDQVDKAFVPEQVVIRQGELVAFPNSDNIRHHVYSFSKAKPFEIKLYKGNSIPPVPFETPGVVVLGCNIHDSMEGYIYVAQSDFHAQTDASGRAVIKGASVADNSYKLRVWYRYQATPIERPLQTILVKNNDGKAYSLTLTTKPPQPKNTFEAMFQ